MNSMEVIFTFNDTKKSILELKNFFVFDLILIFRPIWMYFVVRNKIIKVHEIFIFIFLGEKMVGIWFGI
jgi:hypothetical protein